MSLRKEIDDFLHLELEKMQSRIVEEFESIQILIAQIPVLPKQKASIASVLIIQESLQNIKDLIHQQRLAAAEIASEVEQIDDDLSSRFVSWKAEMEQEEFLAIEKTREMEELYDKEMKSIEAEYQKSLQYDQKYIVSF